MEPEICFFLIFPPKIERSVVKLGWEDPASQSVGVFGGVEPKIGFFPIFPPKMERVELGWEDPAPHSVGVFGGVETGIGFFPQNWDGGSDGGSALDGKTPSLNLWVFWGVWEQELGFFLFFHPKLRWVVMVELGWEDPALNLWVFWGCGTKNWFFSVFSPKIGAGVAMMMGPTGCTWEGGTAVTSQVSPTPRCPPQTPA